MQTCITQHLPAMVQGQNPASEFVQRLHSDWCPMWLDGGTFNGAESDHMQRQVSTRQTGVACALFPLFRSPGHVFLFSAIEHQQMAAKMKAGGLQPGIACVAAPRRPPVQSRAGKTSSRTVRAASENGKSSAGDAHVLKRCTLYK